MYNLSDEALEYQVLDRSSFQCFAGLEKSSRIPDAKTVWVWRERLKKQDLIGDISEAVGRQLAQAGFIARAGQIIDASIVTAPVQHRCSEENEAIKRGEVPADWNVAQRAQKDVDARWTKKHGKSYYGYKLHASTDRRWGFMSRIEVTAASVNDTEVFEATLDETNTAKDVDADRGYAKHARETELYVQGYRAHVQRKGTATQPISDAQQTAQPSHLQAAHLWRTPVRASDANGRMHLRTIGLARARAVIELKVIAHNLMHLARYKDRGVVPA